jgi:hypothetical protein
MNERIKELATLATRQYSPTYYTQEWIQGFAQLIVRECSLVADRAHAEDMGWNIGEIIKEHFGVEE